MSSAVPRRTGELAIHYVPQLNSPGEVTQMMWQQVLQ